MAGHFKEIIQENFDTEVCQGGTEEYRGLFSVADFFNIKVGAGAVQKFDVILQCLEKLITDHAEKFR